MGLSLFDRSKGICYYSAYYDDAVKETVTVPETDFSEPGGVEARYPTMVKGVPEHRVGKSGSEKDGPVK